MDFLYNQNTMFPIKRIILFLSFFAFATLSFAVPQELAELFADYSKKITEINDRFSASINKLPEQYLKELAAQGRRYQKDGALDEILAIKKELERFQNAVNSEAEVDPFEPVPEMPEDAIVDFPESLAKLQKEYIEKKSAFIAKHEREIDNCNQQLIKTMESIQRNSTKQGKLDEAIAIRDEVSKVKEAIESGTFSEYLSGFNTEKKKVETKKKKIEAPATEDAPIRIRTKITSWRKWSFAGARTFSPQLPTLFSDELSSAVSAKYTTDDGRAVFSIGSGKAVQHVGSSACAYVGSAVVWKAKAGEDYSAKLKVTSVKAQNAERARQAKLKFYVRDDAGNGLAEIEFAPEGGKSYSLRITRDSAEPNRYAMLVPGKGSAFFSAPISGGISLVAGVAVANSSDLSEVRISFE